MTNAPSNSHSNAQHDLQVVSVKPVGPPGKHQLAIMIWLAVFPTLTVLNLTIGPWLKDTNAELRTFVLATVAVPIVIYGLMPRLYRIRARILNHRATA